MLGFQLTFTSTSGGTTTQSYGDVTSSTYYQSITLKSTVVKVENIMDTSTWDLNWQLGFKFYLLDGTN